MGKLIGILFAGAAVLIVGFGATTTGVFYVAREKPDVFSNYAEFSRIYLRDRYGFRLALRQVTQQCLVEKLPTKAPKFYEDMLVGVQMNLDKQQAGEGKRKRRGVSVLKRAFKQANLKNKRAFKQRTKSLSETRARDIEQFHTNFTNDPSFFFQCTQDKILTADSA